MKNDLYIKNGHIYRGDVKQKLEFGNTEQIALVKKFNDEMEVVKEFGADVDFDKEEIIRVDITAVFKCVCGKHLSIICEEEDEYFDESDMIGMRSKCGKCGIAYILEYDDSFEIKAKIQQ